jgi:hypothetical protein
MTGGRRGLSIRSIKKKQKKAFRENPEEGVKWS